MAGTFAAVRRRRRALQNYRMEKFCWQTRRCRTMLTSTINCRYGPTVFIGKYVLLSDSSSICVDFWGAHCDKCRSCAHTENLQQKEPAELCWILPLSLHETLTLTLCLHDSAKLQKMPLHPQKQTVTLCHSLLPAGWNTDCTSCHSREESGGRMDPDRAHSWSFRAIQKSDTGLLRDLSHLGFEVQKSQRWKWAHCPQNKMKSYVDSLQSPLVKKNNLYFIIIWTLENFGRLLCSLSCAKWIGDPRSCVSHNEPLWVKCWCMNSSRVSNLDSKSFRWANASPVTS